jgi:hypothetical protein
VVRSGRVGDLSAEQPARALAGGGERLDDPEADRIAERVEHGDELDRPGLGHLQQLDLSFFDCHRNRW